MGYTSDFASSSRDFMSVKSISRCQTLVHLTIFSVYTSILCLTLLCHNQYLVIVFISIFVTYNSVFILCSDCIIAKISFAQPIYFSVIIYIVHAGYIPSTDAYSMLHHFIMQSSIVLGIGWRQCKNLHIIILPLSLITYPLFYFYLYLFTSLF